MKQFFIYIYKWNKEEININVKNNEQFLIIKYELKLNISELKKKHKFIVFFFLK